MLKQNYFIFSNLLVITLYVTVICKNQKLTDACVFQSVSLVFLDQKPIVGRVKYRIVHEGFVYYLRTAKKNARYFRCAKGRSTGCTGSAKTSMDINENNVVVLRQHNHPPDDTIASRVQFETEMKLAAQYMPHLSVKEVYNYVAMRHPNMAPHFPFCHKYYASIRRWKKLMSY